MKNLYLTAKKYMLSQARMHPTTSLVLLITHKLSPFDFTEKKAHQSSPAILRA
jgi:hypothetical protein